MRVYQVLYYSNTSITMDGSIVASAVLLLMGMCAHGAETQGDASVRADLGGHGHTPTNKTSLMDGEAELTEEQVQRSVLIFYIVLVVMIGAQGGLVRWRKLHKRSYELVTLIGLWLVPAIISLHLMFWRFLIVWSGYSGVTGMYLYKCVYTDLWDTTVPKNIYRWFLGVFRVSVGVGLTGYIMLLVDILSGGLLFAPLVESGFSLLLIWYGLYFGILTRDCAEVVSDRMVGSFSKHLRARASVNTVRDCALCGQELRDTMTHIADGMTDSKESNKDTSSVQLNCKHIFHPECIKGWLIVGKKDSCPACNEKVDLRRLYADKPWETRNLSWIQMLDMVRYLIVWQPTIMTALHFVFHVLHMDEDLGPPDANTNVHANTTDT